MAIDNGWQPPKDPNYKPTPQAKPQQSQPQQQKSIDVFTPLIDITPKGKPLSTIENMQEILNRIGVIARYNVINKQIELLIPDVQFSIDNQANAALAHVLSCTISRLLNKIHFKPKLLLACEERPTASAGRRRPFGPLVPYRTSKYSLAGLGCSPSSKKLQSPV